MSNFDNEPILTGGKDITDTTLETIGGPLKLSHLTNTKGLVLPNLVDGNFKIDINLDKKGLFDLVWSLFRTLTIHGTNSMKELWEFVKWAIDMQKIYVEKEGPPVIDSPWNLFNVFNLIYTSQFSPHFDKANKADIDEMISYVYKNSPFHVDLISEADSQAREVAKAHIYPKEDSFGYSFRAEDDFGDDSKVISDNIEEDDLIGLWRYVFSEVNRLKASGLNDSLPLVNIFKRIYRMESADGVKDFNFPLVDDIIKYIYDECPDFAEEANRQAHKEVFGSYSRG